MIIDDMQKSMTNKMDKAIEALKASFASIRTGRASVHLLDKMKAEVYGVMTPIQQLGNISAPEPRMLTIEVYDKNAVKPVERALRESTLGFNPQVEGCLLRINLPDLTEERRKELTKHAANYAHECLVSHRNARHELLDKAKKLEQNGEITKDDLEWLKKEVQKIIDDYHAKVDALLEQKKKDIMMV